MRKRLSLEELLDELATDNDHRNGNTRPMAAGPIVEVTSVGEARQVSGEPKRQRTEPHLCKHRSEGTAKRDESKSLFHFFTYLIEV